MSEELSNMMPQIYKVMKYASQPPHTVESDDDFAATFEGFPNLGYSVRNKKVIKHVSNPAIPMCQYAGDPEEWTMDTCNIMKRSITNIGFGYTFNNVDFWMLYQKTPFTKTYSDVMAPKGHEKPQVPFDWRALSSLPISQAKNLYQLGDVRTPTTSGTSNTLILVLESPKLYDNWDKHYLRDNTHMYKLIGKSFKVNIHDPFSVPDLRLGIS